MFSSRYAAATVLAGLSHLNPLSYMISGFRYGFLGIWTMSRWSPRLACWWCSSLVFYLICWSLIQRGRGLRS
ncbi:hypothetical protein ACNKHQ_00780 [Shigella flexneri]